MKRKILFILILAIVILGEIMSVKTLAMKQNLGVEFENGEVTASKLNIRKGPSTDYGVVDTVNSGDKLKIYANLDGWYLIQTQNDIVGCVSSE